MLQFWIGLTIYSESDIQIRFMWQISRRNLEKFKGLVGNRRDNEGRALPYEESRLVGSFHLSIYSKASTGNTSTSGFRGKNRFKIKIVAATLILIYLFPLKSSLKDSLVKERLAFPWLFTGNQWRFFLPYSVKIYWKICDQ